MREPARAVLRGGGAAVRVADGVDHDGLLVDGEGGVGGDGDPVVWRGRGAGVSEWEGGDKGEGGVKGS